MSWTRISIAKMNTDDQLKHGFYTLPNKKPVTA
jgi:hypothetical protein